MCPVSDEEPRNVLGRDIIQSDPICPEDDASDWYGTPGRRAGISKDILKLYVEA